MKIFLQNNMAHHEAYPIWGRQIVQMMVEWHRAHPSLGIKYSYQHLETATWLGDDRMCEFSYDGTMLSSCVLRISTRRSCWTNF